MLLCKSLIKSRGFLIKSYNFSLTWSVDWPWRHVRGLRTWQHTNIFSKPLPLPVQCGESDFFFFFFFFSSNPDSDIRRKFPRGTSACKSMHVRKLEPRFLHSKDHPGIASTQEAHVWVHFHLKCSWSNCRLGPTWQELSPTFFLLF